MKNQYPTFSMDGVRGADLTQRHKAGLGSSKLPVGSQDWRPLTVQLFINLKNSGSFLTKICMINQVGKLQHYSINGHILKWISEFLSGCTQCVVVDGAASSWSAIETGVPQGTVLGLLLFLVLAESREYLVRRCVVLLFRGFAETDGLVGNFFL